MNITEALSASVTIRDFIVITHAIPARRVRDKIPEPLKLQTFMGTDGEEKALISATCFFNENLKWTLSRWPALNFFESTYRVYVAHGEAPGVYFFRNFVETAASYALEKPLFSSTMKAEFDVSAKPDPAGRSVDAFIRPRSRNRGGMTHFSIRRTEAPSRLETFADEKSLERFITWRPSGFFTGPRGELMNLRVRHRPMEPWRAELLSGRFEPWELAGLLSKEEAQAPVAVHVQPSLEFRIFPPLPLRVIEPAFWRRWLPA